MVDQKAPEEKRNRQRVPPQIRPTTQTTKTTAMPDRREEHRQARGGALGGSWEGRSEGAALVVPPARGSENVGPPEPPSVQTSGMGTVAGVEFKFRSGARTSTRVLLFESEESNSEACLSITPKLAGKTQALASSSQGHSQRSVQLCDQNDEYGIGGHKDEHADVVPADEPRERCQERGTGDRHLAALDDDGESHSNKTMLNKALSGKRCRRRHRRYCYRRGIWSGDRVGAFGRLLLAVPLASMWRTLGVEAVFAPRNRAELQGDGGAELGVFGCVGACGRGLENAGKSTSFCSPSANGPWESGDGACVNADKDVPDGQGTGKYGAIGTWDVSEVESMYRSESPPISPLPPSLSLFLLCVCVCPRAPLSLSFCLLSHLSSLHPQCFGMRISSTETSRHGMSPQ